MDTEKASLQKQSWILKAYSGSVIFIDAVLQVVFGHPCKETEHWRAVTQSTNKQQIPVCAHSWSHSYAEVHWQKKSAQAL